VHAEDVTSPRKIKLQAIITGNKNSKIAKIANDPIYNDVELAKAA